MRVLTIDAALGRCSVAIVENDQLIAERYGDEQSGLAPMVQSVMRGAKLDMIAVTTGPGRFTGLRAALALAQGLGVGAGVDVVGVSVVESLADALPQLGQRSLWVAIDSRRGRIFLHHEGSIVSVALDAIPTPLGPVAIAGDAAIALASRLAAKGYNVMLTDARLPQPRHIAAVAQKRAAGLLAPLALVPLYVDPPEARAMPLRPPPA